MTTWHSSADGIQDGSEDDAYAPTEGYDSWYPSSDDDWYDSQCEIPGQESFDWDESSSSCGSDYDDYTDEEPEQTP